ncbi:MAG TPA: hypothetical protein VFO11_04455 [Candidatus Polarisedimenticolaceae bacterium]|nr:hypothetical protein [Candidatus Polarisedimenticolaceae bacterium]
MPRAILLLLAFLAAAPVGAEIPDAMLNGLSWRLVGPHRAGWATVAAGDPADRRTFYFGAAGGGVWKSDDAGRTWRSVFDEGPASIGGLAVAPSDPKRIYVGTGQVTSRYDMAAGAGVFRSRDAGETWEPAGLAGTRHIGAVVVDPRNADVVLVAASGHAFADHPERGVYRSQDGGVTWERTLFVSEKAGAVDLALDPASSDVVFASVWQVRYRPWMSYYDSGEGEQSGIYRSRDNGRTWTRIQGGGWPKGALGRIGLAAAHVAGTTRVYATVQSAASGGLYRSDDAGDTWRRVNSDTGLGSSYFSHVTILPGDADTVFVMGRSMRRCTSGGTTCEYFKGSPGGDDYHHLWIDPQDPSRMITGCDQGAVVTMNAGVTWSSWYNQPTGQFYHLATDDQFPYRIYSGQQDCGTVSIASRSDYGAISFREWRSVGADERDDDIPDPLDPEIVYGSGLGGRLSRWHARNGEVQNVSPWPVSSYGARPTTVKYHYGWITPIAISKVPPHPLYQGAQVLFRSTDRGAHWKTISPDLTKRGKDAKDCRGDPDFAQARACGYGVIASIGLAPKDNETIWIGTDDGRVRLTRDAGTTWKDVTPPDVPPWTKIASIDVSEVEPDTVYVAGDGHRRDDFTPLAWRTRDFGVTWQPIAAGLPRGEFTSVLRADPVKRGLLYAATDRGVYVSFDDGGSWRSLRRNMPTAIVTDLLVHGDDVVVSTQGRAIWVLDDVAPLREMTDGLAAEPVHLFTPADAVRVRRNQNKDTPLPPEEPVGKNPPTGAILDYWLAAATKTPVTLTIRNAGGEVVKTFDGGATPEMLPGNRYFHVRWAKPAPVPGSTAGAHRFVWDLRGPRPRVGEYEYSIAAVDGEHGTQVPEGMLVPPGIYRVTLTADGREATRSFTVNADPRVPLDLAAVEAAASLSREIVAVLARQSAAAGELKKIRQALENAKAAAAFEAAVAPLLDGADDEAPNLNGAGEVLLQLQIDLEGSDRAPTSPQREAFAAQAARVEKGIALWERIKAEQVPALGLP